MVIDKTFNKDKLIKLIGAYHKIFEEGNRNIFNFNDFLKDSGITGWNKEYIEYMFYYFDDKPLFDGIGTVLYDSNTLYAIKFLEPFGLNLFNELKVLEFSKDEGFFNNIPSLEKIGYIEFPYLFYLEYFKNKYSTEKESKMIKAEFKPEYFKPKGETKENHSYVNYEPNTFYPDIRNITVDDLRNMSAHDLRNLPTERIRQIMNDYERRTGYDTSSIRGYDGYGGYDY